MARPRKYKILNNQAIEYAYKHTDKHYLENGSFIAVKIIEYFILNTLRGNELKFSNIHLAGKFYCSVSGLQDAFKVLESDGIVIRTFNDEEKRDRSEFKLDLEKAITWLSTTTYSDNYKNAPRRSLFRAFVNQAVIFIRNKSGAIKKELTRYKGKYDAKVRAAKVKELNEKLDKEYDRYLRHLKTRTEKLEAKRERLDTRTLQERANSLISDLVIGWGFEPPGMIKS